MKLSLLSLLAVSSLFAVACTASTDDAEETDDVSVEEALRADVSAGDFKLYSQPRHQPNPSCDVHTKLELAKTGYGSKAVLTEALDGFCEIYVQPNKRTYRLKEEGTSCGSKIYSGKRRKNGETYSIKIIDHRTRLCRDLVPARVIVEESVPGFPGAITTTKYSFDGQPAGQELTESGTFVSVAGIGGESTGYGLQLEGGGFYELVLDPNEAALFEDGKKARVTGKLTFLSGVETRNRRAIDVTSILTCPTTRYVNCMPPVRPGGYCSATEWVTANCPGVDFVY
ncbi:MAG: hypothetical protein KC657_00465 [Myxococcales bacterium]|nr:hypothetical protein [Myxococcales bacterium]